MKSLIDYEQVREIIEKRRKEHVDNFSNYRYHYNNMSIDDAIIEAKAAKELEQIIAEIKNITPPVSDFEPIYNAVVTLGDLYGVNIAGKYINIDAIKTIADYLGIDISKKESAEGEE